MYQFNYNSFGKYSELFLVLCFFVYIVISVSYWVNEYYRPFLYVFLPVSLFSCLTFYIRAYLKASSKRLALKNGFVIGITISSLLMILNFLEKKPIDLQYKVSSISKGRSGSFNMYVRTDSNEEVVFNILGVSKMEHLTEAKFIFYEGILGFYFGDWELNKET